MNPATPGDEYTLMVKTTPGNNERHVRHVRNHGRAAAGDDIPPGGRGMVTVEPDTAGSATKLDGAVHHW